MVIGWTALLAGVLGLVHVASGTPELSAGLPAIRSAGGIVGFAVSAPLVAVITKWAAIPVLVLHRRVRPARGDRDATAPRSRPNRGAARVHPAPAECLPTRDADECGRSGHLRAAAGPAVPGGAPRRSRSGPGTGRTTRRCSVACSAAANANKDLESASKAGASPRPRRSGGRRPEFGAAGPTPAGAAVRLRVAGMTGRRRPMAATAQPRRARSQRRPSS